MKKLSIKDRTIHEQFSSYGRNAKEWMNKCVLMLPLIQKNAIWAKKGFCSIYEYAAKVAGMSRNKVNEGLRILNKTENMPAIRKVIEQKGIFAVKPIVTIATPETDEFWAKRASEMKRSTLETFVKDFKHEQQATKTTQTQNGFLVQKSDGYGRPGAWKSDTFGFGKPGNFQDAGEKINKNNFDEKKENQQRPKIQVSMKLDKEIFETLIKIKGTGDWNTAMKKLLQGDGNKEKKSGKNQSKVFMQINKHNFTQDNEQNPDLTNKQNFTQSNKQTDNQTTEQIEISEIQRLIELEKEKPSPVRSNNHTVPTAIEKYIIKRSGGKCEHPGCNKEATHIHHANTFATTKTHDPDKLLHLCEEHHILIHLGYINDSLVIEEMLKKNSPANFKKSNFRYKKAWTQIKKLPSYDFKNVINQRIAEFKLFEKHKLLNKL